MDHHPPLDQQQLNLYSFDSSYDPSRTTFPYPLSHNAWPLPLSDDDMSHPIEVQQQVQQAQHYQHQHEHQQPLTQHTLNQPQQLSQHQHQQDLQQQNQQQRQRVLTTATSATTSTDSNALTTSTVVAPLQTMDFGNFASMAPNPMLTEWININANANAGFSSHNFNGLPMAHTDFGAQFAGSLQDSPVEFGINTSQAALLSSMAMDAPFNMMPMATMGMTSQLGAPFSMADFRQEISQSSPPLDLVGTSATSNSVSTGSPSEQWLEITSPLGSDGWHMVEQSGHRNSYDLTNDVASLTVFNPAQSLHLHTRTGSDSSQHSEAPTSAQSTSSFEEIQYPMSSPQSEADNSLELVRSHASHAHSHSHSASCSHSLPVSDNEFGNYISPNPSVSPSMARVEPAIKLSASNSSSPTSSAQLSPPARRKKSPVETPGAKPAKVIQKKTAHSTRKDAQGEKRVGRRRGPLRPDQRQQAHEIRKLRACLRCKFLKKTCDKGDPCGGCQPSHARLWQVPCTRIDIKDINYFMKDWKADYERHISLGFSIGNIKGFSAHERPIYITHGYGHFLPIMAREVYVNDDKCFGVDWCETLTGLRFEINTAKLSVGMEGVSKAVLSEYLDRHFDGGFEAWVDEYFEGTYFVTEILKTAYRFYCREKLPVIRKALKLVIAYNLTLHVTMVEGLGEEGMPIGKVEDETSKFCGKTVAPVMINFQVKCALADMWRELQKEVLEELSSLYSSVYSGDKLKNWPTIFMLAAIILCVWELMQFDCVYRVPDQAAVQKFCTDMEGTPVGVIVGLFSAISQKLPSFAEWDTAKHHHLLHSNMAVCDAMTEVRAHVTKYNTYLRSRSDCKFDRNDFDSLSNKFLSKLVIRAN